jgi:hypothetical protein
MSGLARPLRPGMDCLSSTACDARNDQRCPSGGALLSNVALAFGMVTGAKTKWRHREPTFAAGTASRRVATRSIERTGKVRPCAIYVSRDLEGFQRSPWQQTRRR